MHVRIGNQTAFSASTITEPFEYAVANGFDAFEWFPDKKESGEGWTEDDITKQERALIEETARVSDISLSVHVPWDVNPVRPETHGIVLKNIEFAQDIGATLLNVHLHTDEGLSSYVEAILGLVKRLADTGIKLSVENTPITVPQDFNELFGKLETQGCTGGAQVGMCLDTGHANLCEQTRNDYLEFVDLLDPQVPIVHIHIHENYGDHDSHMPLFTGPAKQDDWGVTGLVERLKKRNMSGCIILEQWPQPPALLNKARDMLREMMKMEGRR